VLTAPETLEFTDVDAPDIPEGWVLLRTELTGLCGTDFSILHGTHPRAVAPLIMGHEITGVVEVTAAGGPPVGTRCIVEPLISCGKCRACRDGATHVCRDLKLYGIDTPGSLAEFIAVPASSVVPVASSVSVELAALAEPLAVAVHAVARSGLTSGQNVVIFGAGPIGILTALVARHAGVDDIVVIEPSEARRLVAESLGFATVPPTVEPVGAVLSATGGDGADVVFDTAAHPTVAALVTKVVRVQGTVVVVGVHKQPVPVDLQALTFMETSFVGVRVYTRADVERAVELIEAGALGLERFPTQVFPLEEAAEAFQTALASTGVLKVFVGPPRDGSHGSR
jgi:(R,R)-butanediol dehydrogenase/meso-butanediol dehydrogenase/diacetyl reductase